MNAKRGAGLIFVSLVLVALWRFWAPGETVNAVSYRTAPVARQEILVKISSTGTVEPEEIVDVGAQVAGIIREFGKAPGTNKVIDYGSPVEAGTVLARIDDASYSEEVALSRASLLEAQAKQKQAVAGAKQAEANIKRAEADLLQGQVVFKQAVRDRERVQSLVAKTAVSQSEVETAQKAVEVAEAAVAVAEATLVQVKATRESTEALLAEAEARVAGAQASLRKATTNLGYTTIVSPIHGVIIDRRVNIGQTVVANLNAPSLFLIAKDLKRVQVWVSVNEADIGSIKVGQNVSFTVDTYPNEVFRGTVGQVRLNASMVQNVVTYTVVVTVDNSSGKLLPYLTANLRFEVDRRDKALSVPAAALRWKPKTEQVVEDQRAAATATEPRKKGKDKPSDDGGSAIKKGIVWIAEGSLVRGVEIELGLSDGNLVEVLGGNLKEGQEVVIGEQSKTKEKTVNPFTPSLAKGIDQSK